MVYLLGVDGSIVFRRFRWVDARFNDSHNDVIYLVLGVCYSSTLYETLKESYYPWPNLGPGTVTGIYFPRVVVFKDNLDHNYVDLPEAERRVVSGITFTGTHGPKLTEYELGFKNESDLLT